MMDEIKDISAQLEVHRLLLLQLYKQSFLADPDLESQLANDLLQQVGISPNANLTVSGAHARNSNATKEKLKVFFEDVAQIVERVRHQPLQKPPE